MLGRSPRSPTMEREYPALCLSSFERVDRHVNPLPYSHESDSW